MDKDMTAEQTKTKEMVKSMTYTYREMERGLLKTIAAQEEKVEGQEEMKRKLKTEIQQLQLAKEEMI